MGEYSEDEQLATAVSYFDWVCGNKNKVDVTLTLVFVSSVFSPLIFSPLADMIGRKPVFFITEAIIIVFSIGAVYSSSAIAFQAQMFLRMLSHPSLMNVVLLLAIELVCPDQRSTMGTIVSLTFPIGMCINAGIIYLLKGHWRISTLVSQLPMLYFFLFIKMVPESPRWLASKGKIQEAKAIMEKIAKENENKVPHDLESRLQIKEKTIENKGFLSFFRYPKLIIWMVAITLSFSSHELIYYGVMLNLENIGGSIYINYIVIALIEIPGYFAGWWALNNIGRRFSASFFSLLSGIACMLAAFMPKDIEWPLIAFSALGKFGCSGTYLAVAMHGPELFPTHFRSTAMAIPMILSRSVTSLTPFITSLSDVSHMLPFLIMGSICLIAAPAHFTILPETIGRGLPQTVEEAYAISKGQKFWSLNKLKNSDQNKKG